MIILPFMHENQFSPNTHNVLFLCRINQNLSPIFFLLKTILQEYLFDMQYFKNSEFGWVEKQYLQLYILGCCMLCLMENTRHFIGEMSY